MRIAFSLHTEMLAGAGAPTVVTTLAAAMAARGHRTSLLTLSDLDPRIPEKLRGPIFPLVAAARFRREAGDLDVIDASTGDAWIYAALRGRGGPLLVTHSHGLEHVAHEALLADVARGGQSVSWRYPFYHGGLRLWEVRRSLLRSDLCLFLNDYNRDFAVERLGVDPGRCHVVANGCDDLLLDHEPAVAPPAPGKLRIAMIGSYYAGKGVAYAARALDGVMRRHPGVDVVFLGTGCGADTVRADYHPALHDRIGVVPRFDRSALPAMLDDRQVLLFPSLTEGFPLSLLEGMACGLVPVVSLLPGTRNIVTDGVDALTIPPACEAPIERALERLIADPALLARLRGSARATASRYRWSRIAADRERLYAAYIDRRREERTRR